MVHNSDNNDNNSGGYPISLRKHAGIIGYAILILFIVVGFVRMEAEAANRVQEQCEIINSQGEAIVLFTHMLREFADEPDDTPEEAAAKDEFVRRVEESMAPQDC